MSFIEGVVEKIAEQKSPAGSGRKWTKKGMLVDGTWYNAFVNAENKSVLDEISDGTVVKIGLEQKGEYTNVTSVEILSAKQVKESPAAQKSTASLTDKDLRLQYQGSRRDAISFVEMLIPLDILPLPTKKADKADAIYEYMKYYADKFTADAFAAKLNAEKNKNNDTDESSVGVE